MIQNGDSIPELMGDQSDHIAEAGEKRRLSPQDDILEKFKRAKYQPIVKLSRLPLSGGNKLPLTENNNPIQAIVEPREPSQNLSEQENQSIGNRTWPEIRQGDIIMDEISHTLNNDEKIAESNDVTPTPLETPDVSRNDSETINQTGEFSKNDSENNLSVRFRNYEEHEQCAQPDLILERYTNIPAEGNCLFDSLIVLKNWNVSPIQLRRYLLNSKYLPDCADPLSAIKILSSDDQYGDVDTIFIFSRQFYENVCIHLHCDDRIRYAHVKVSNSPVYLHLHLRGLHFTPFFSRGHRPEGIGNISNEVTPENHEDLEMLSMEIASSPDDNFQDDESLMETQEIDNDRENYSYNHAEPNVEFPENEDGGAGSTNPGSTTTDSGAGSSVGGSVTSVSDSEFS
ncbi:hypothetical protein QAD02_005064 [Eretmocerus hayati]|uniref:Uncharacterized protein n=1 Tax=Eretmocerus hayati TaxID=131215 RepID=A0ACC2NRU0_9HYME|nr:hypothetical protein QAD02_005064 [Eretmocerus hayati]